MKALIIDDDKVSTFALKKELEYFEVESVVCLSGEEGKNVFEKSEIGEYQLIFLDIMMPDKKGSEISASIRSLKRDDAMKIPIVAITGINYDMINRALEVSGFNAVIKKPVSMDILEGLIKTIDLAREYREK